MSRPQLRLRVSKLLDCCKVHQGPSQYKDCLSWYRDSYYKVEMVVRPSYLYDGNPYTGKTVSLYWDALRRHLWCVNIVAKSVSWGSVSIPSMWLLKLITPWTKWPPFWQTTLSNEFSWMKMVEFWFKFHWNLFPWVQLTIGQHWFR